MAFRDSAKSTIITQGYAIWSILGKQKAKFVIIVGNTQRQAKQHHANIKQILEHEQHSLLRSDLGPFKEESDEWGAYSLVIPKYNAKILSVSTEQSIRGIRYNEHRPDLIILDDIEDSQSVKTKDNRDKLYNWVTTEIIPAGHLNTRLFAVGNMLHPDSLMMRLKNYTEDNLNNSVFRRYPIIDEEGTIAWPGKFSDLEAVEAERRRIGNEVAWQKEFMLNPVEEDWQVFRKEWIHNYDMIPEYNSYTSTVFTAVDLAISEKQTADYTAMVSVMVVGYDKNQKVYVYANPVNKRMDFPTAIKEAVQLSKFLGHGRPTKMVVEDVAYQRAFVQELKQYNVPAESFKPNGLDKKARAIGITHMMETGKVLFPKVGCEALIDQLLNFGIEKHDDLVDAFVMALTKAMESRSGSFVINEKVWLI